MRIICDHCSQPVSGTVKRVTGNLNLHPDCLAQLAKEGKLELTAVSWRSGESSVSMMLERKVEPIGSREGDTTGPLGCVNR